MAKVKSNEELAASRNKAAEKPAPAKAVKKQVAEKPQWIQDLHIGPSNLPPRICIYGGHGIGKSTIGAMFPSAIFINTEDGLDAIDCVSFPVPKVAEDIADQIRILIKQEHKFKTVVIDTVDWLIDPLITRDIEGSHDDKELGYGRGSVMIAEAFREILNGLDILRRRRGMNVVLLAHAEVKRFDSPLTEPYDRYVPKLTKKSNAILQEWVDVLCYVGYRVIVKKTEAGFGKKVSRGVSTGKRVMHFQEEPGFLAKARYPETPESCKMSYDALKEAIPKIKE